MKYLYTGICNLIRLKHICYGCWLATNVIVSPNVHTTYKEVVGFVLIRMFMMNMYCENNR